MIRTLFIFLLLYLFAGCSMFKPNPFAPAKYPEESEILILKRVQSSSSNSSPIICGYGSLVDGNEWAVGATIQSSPKNGTQIDVKGDFKFRVEEGEVELIAKTFGYRNVSKKLKVHKGETVIVFVEFTPSTQRLYLD